MKRKYLCDPVKMVVGLVMFLTLFSMGAFFLRGGKLVGGLAVLALALVFAYVVWMYGAVITIDEEGICRSFLGFNGKKTAWQDICEVNVLDTKYNRNKSYSNSGKYIYFSMCALDEAARFKICLEWPPNSGLFIKYTREKLDNVQSLTEKNIVTYNLADNKHRSKKMMSLCNNKEEDKYV